MIGKSPYTPSVVVQRGLLIAGAKSCSVMAPILRDARGAETQFYQVPVILTYLHRPVERKVCCKHPSALSPGYAWLCRILFSLCKSFQRAVAFGQVRFKERLQSAAVNVTCKKKRVGQWRTHGSRFSTCFYGPDRLVLARDWLTQSELLSVTCFVAFDGEVEGIQVACMKNAMKLQTLGHILGVSGWVIDCKVP